MSLRSEDDKRVARSEDEKDEVEAHGNRVAMNEEPKAEDDSDDDFEAHGLRSE